MHHILAKIGGKQFRVPRLESVCIRCHRDVDRGAQTIKWFCAIVDRSKSGDFVLPRVTANVVLMGDMTQGQLWRICTRLYYCPNEGAGLMHKEGLDDGTGWTGEENVGK